MPALITAVPVPSNARHVGTSCTTRVSALVPFIPALLMAEYSTRWVASRIRLTMVALQNGVDIKTVSSMLGHYDAGFTLRTYTHATRQMQDQAAETMGNFMTQMM